MIFSDTGEKMLNWKLEIEKEKVKSKKEKVRNKKVEGKM